MSEASGDSPQSTDPQNLREVIPYKESKRPGIQRIVDKRKALIGEAYPELGEKEKNVIARQSVARSLKPGRTFDEDEKFMLLKQLKIRDSKNPRHQNLVEREEEDLETTDLFKNEPQTTYVENSVYRNRIARRAVARALTSERRQQRAEKLMTQSLTDEITGLPNRNAFEIAYPNKVEVANRLHQNPGLMFLDNEGLKPVNDQISQEAGDSLLAVTGAILKVAVGENGIVYRYGGDEWMVYLHDTSSKKVDAIWEGLDEEAKKEHLIKYQKPETGTGQFEDGEFTRKIGIRGTFVPIDTQHPFKSVVEAKAMLKQAKEAQKKSGGNVLLKKPAALGADIRV